MTGPNTDLVTAIKSTLAIHTLGSIWLVGSVLLGGSFS
jgi:hypothetical protein